MTSSVVHSANISIVMLRRITRHLQQIAKFLQTHNNGLILLTGPMRAGKSTVLLNLIEIFREDPPLCIKPMRDDRQSGLETHTGITANAYSVTSGDDIAWLLQDKTYRYVIVDEAQFFAQDDAAQNDVASSLLKAAEDALVVVAMLDETFEPAPWPMFTRLSKEGPQRHPNAFLHLKLMGVCQICGNRRGTHSKLMIEAPKHSTVLTGASIYSTTCKRCHAPPPPTS